ncbi:hypothetical protein CEXT_289771 [Caerostris extrusa]|uniref:Uncharacterized protein n=1 Tax=Caerostris extrusa TaxID=172846 RepID=A0AAV4N971_CAEEX|nr:hypothetical protein CEXT_289771 [Caerostris extrusa]
MTTVHLSLYDFVPFTLSFHSAESGSSANTDIHRSLKLQTLPQFISKLAPNFYTNIPNINNELLKRLPEYDINNPKNSKRPRTSLLIS